MEKTLNLVTFGFLAIALECIPLAQAAAPEYQEGQSMFYRWEPSLDRVLSIGGFHCGVAVIEPNGGTGEPRLYASVRFDDHLNLTATGVDGVDFSFAFSSGSKEGLLSECRELAEDLSGTAASQGCTAGPIRTSQVVGGNFVEDSWDFDIICNGERNHVVNAVGVLIEELILAVEPGALAVQ